MHRPSAPVVALLAALAAGCGETNGDGDGSSTKAVKTETSAARPKPKADPDARIRRELRRYVRENFGGAFGPGSETHWYSSVKGYVVDGGDVTVKTDVFPDSDAPPTAQSICAAMISASLPADDPIVDGLAGARVLDAGGGLIKRCLRAGSARW